MQKLVKTIRCSLPKDVEHLKEAGLFKEEAQLIDQYLNRENLPGAVKERLLVEKEIIPRLITDYPYTEEEALALVQKEIPDFSMEELHRWMETGAADWILIDSKKHLQDRFFASMKKVYPEIAQRAGVESDARSYLDDVIHTMKINGRSAWHAKLEASLKIKDDVFHPGRVRVHLPVPAACLNMKNIQIQKTEPEHCRIDDLYSLSRTVCFEEEIQENHPFTVTYSYDSEVTYHDVKPDGAYVNEDMRVGQEEGQIVFTPLVQALCKELSGDETNPVILARRFYDFITTKVMYAFMPQYLTLGQIPDYCLSSLKGDCGVQALTFITLCRCAGIPAKWQSGKFVTPTEAGNHDWAMFHIEPYGWLFADCSFGGSAYRAGNSARHDFYFGNLDPFRMAANNAFQKEFFVPKKHWRIDPFDNQSGEAEYEDRGLRKGELETSLKVLEMNQIVGK